MSLKAIQIKERKLSRGLEQILSMLQKNICEHLFSSRKNRGENNETSTTMESICYEGDGVKSEH